MRFSKLVMPGVTMIAVTYGLSRFSFGLLLPDMAETLGMSESVSGVVSSLFYLAYCFTIVASIVITARKGPRGMILLAGASALVGLSIMSMTPNIWVLMLGVLLAGASTGLVSPPYGAAISLWIQNDEQGKANTWINSGTSLGIILTGAGAIVLTPHWRLTYAIYAIMALIVLMWNFRAVPKRDKSSITLEKGSLKLKGAKGASSLIAASIIFGVSTAPFWTFSKSFIEVTGAYSDWALSSFWIMIGLFGILGGYAGYLVEKIGLKYAYKIGSILIASAPIILAIQPENIFVSYVAAGLFGAFYIFVSGVLLVWGIRVFIHNASLGIGVPFLILALGQVFGSAIAGSLIDMTGYAITFIVFGFVGLTAIFVGPKQKRKKQHVFSQYLKRQKFKNVRPRWQ